MKAKSLIAFLLGSLILVYIGHNIMPNHHHLDDDHTGDANNHSSHCHAFNGLDYVVSIENQFNLHPVELSLIISIASIPGNDGPLIQEFQEDRNRGRAHDFPGIWENLPV